jgi:hypothetical protein
MPDSAITPGSSLALIGNAAEQTFGAERTSRSEAFSMGGQGEAAGVCGGRGVRGWNQLRNCCAHRLRPADCPRSVNDRGTPINACSELVANSLFGLWTRRKPYIGSRRVTRLLRSLGGQRFYHRDILQQLLWQTVPLL